MLTVSPEELSLRDGMVVCPQCLKAYQAVEAGTLPLAEVRHAQSSDGAAPSKRFCPHCGQDIGHGINFCPYCGRSLHAADVPAAQAVAVRPDAAVPASGPYASRAKEESSQSSSGQSPASTASPAQPEVEFDWKPMIPSYRLIQHRQHEPASLGFQAFAIAVILALLVLLAFIIYHALLLQ